MRPLLSILIYTNCWVALCVSALVFGTIQHYHLPQPEIYAIWSFTGTVSAYQLHRLFRLRQLHHTVRSNRRLLWMQNTYPLQIGWFILNTLAFSVCTCLISITTETVALIALNACIVGLYALPIKFLGNGIRHIPFAKNMLISLSWTCIVLIPFMTLPHLIRWEIPVLVFLAVFAQIIPFDSRDVGYDSKSMRTIPQLFGIKMAGYIGFAILITALLIQTKLLGFHWLLPFTIFCGAVGHLIPFKVGYQLRQEFMWELPLGLMGLWFWVSGSPFGGG